MKDSYQDDLIKISGFIKDLAGIQRQSEDRFDKLAETQKRSDQRIDRLIENQKCSDQRIDRLAESVDSLIIAQTKSDQRIDKLTESVDRLSEAQERTDQRIDKLAESQEKTEIALHELTGEHKNTAKALRELTGEHKKTRSQLGGLSMTVGYRLEDEAFKALPDLLRRDYGIIINERLKRQYVEDKNGLKREVNIFGQAERNSAKIIVLGEAKSQLSKKNVDKYIKKQLQSFEGVFDEIFPILITYMISEPDVEKYAKDKGIALYYSYDF